MNEKLNGRSDLKEKTISGIIWTVLQRYSRMLILFISDIILARLLTPFDYGCIGILAIFMLIAEVFIDSGFGAALIQKKTPTQEDYSTIFFWNIGLAILLYAILFLTAPYIAQFYRIPLLSPVLRVQGVILFVYAFNIVQNSLIRKNLDFKVLSIVTIVTSVVSLLVTIVMAFRGYGVWSLVAQNILTAAIPAIVFWFYVKWRPVLTFSWKSFKELFSFGFYMFLIELVSQFAYQIQGLLIGRFYTPSIMGYYSKAANTEKVASTSLSQVMSQVTYPLYASVQDDKDTLTNLVRRLTKTIAYISFPLIFILLLCAKPIFVFLYTERWIECVPYFQVLCLAGLAYCLQSVNYQSVTAIGKSKIMFEWTIVKRAGGISFIIVGFLLFGMTGILVGIVLHTWFTYFVNIYLVSKFIGYKWWIQLLDIMPIILISIVSTVVSLVSGLAFDFGLYGDCFLKILIYIVIYLSCSVVFKLESFQFCMKQANIFANRIKNHI